MLQYLSYLEFHTRPFGCFPYNPSRRLPESRNRTGCHHREETIEAASLKNKTVLLTYFSACTSTTSLIWDSLQIRPQRFSVPPWKIKPSEVVRFVDSPGCCTPQPLLAGSYMSFLQVAGPQQYVPEMPYVIFSSFATENRESLTHFLSQNHLFSLPPLNSFHNSSTHLSTLSKSHPSCLALHVSLPHGKG